MKEEILYYIDCFLYVTFLKLVVFIDKNLSKYDERCASYEKKNWKGKVK